MKEQLQYCLSAFKKLRRDTTHDGAAPHKPILLISVLQAFRNKLITTNRIYITPELVALFKTNWTILVTSKHNCRISYPFYYLKSDKFWKLIPKQGFENIDAFGSIMKSFSNLNAAVEYALIENDLFILMNNPHSNAILTQFLLDEYFNESKKHFKTSAVYQARLFDDLENKILHEDAEEYRREIMELMEEKNEEEIYLRGGVFKREIPKIYNNTCSISGMRIDATINISMIDACHIVPFSESYDDTITNGIALCPNLHRAFDRGLISIDENYKVLIRKNFTESIQSPYLIKAFEGKKITLPPNTAYYPSQENIARHRNKFEF